MSSATLVCRSSLWTSEAHPTTNYWRKTGYIALSAASGARDYGYLYFPLPFNKGVKITRATLTIETRALPAMTSRQIAVEALTGGMNFTVDTWNVSAGTTTTNSVTLTKDGAQTDGTTWTFDVSKMVQTFSDGATYGGFRLHTNDSGLILVQGHLMGPSLAPTLYVEWSDAPLPPDTLSPSGGRGIGDPTPTVRFNFADYSGNRNMKSAQVQVQTNTANAVFTPDWDSGEIATSVPQVDLGAAGFTGGGTGNLLYWRVRVKDGAGLWSDWSAATSYTYYDPPTVKLANPDSTGTVTDGTPPIDWTYTGSSPQSAFEIGIYRQTTLGGWKLHEASGKIAGGQTEWTPGKSIGANGTYKVIVDVWDSRDREAVPGTPVYASVEQVFQYKSGQAAAPYGGGYYDLAPYPGVHLWWSSATEPDKWLVMCDGEHFGTYAGNGLFTGGAENNSYGLSDLQILPRKPHTFTIYAVQNGVASQPLTIVATTKPLGSWLVSLDGALKLCIVNDTSRDVAFTEDTGTYTPVGSQSTMVVTKGLRGYEGTLKGQLRSIPQFPSMYAENWKQAALHIKEDAAIGTRFWVIFGDERFQANLADLQVVRSPTSMDTYDFSVKFYQQADYDFVE